MTGRARARARGRARGQALEQQVGARPQCQQPGYMQPRLQPPPPGELVGRGRQRAPRGAEARFEEPQLERAVGKLSLAERGGHRQDFQDPRVNTRQSPGQVQRSKTGSSGTVLGLITNHFRLTSRPQWSLYQYHIDYDDPLMKARRLRSALLFQHENLIGSCHAFDGTILFLPRRLRQKVIADLHELGEGKFSQVTEVMSQTRSGENVKITITLTCELPPTSPTCLQFYNIIFRRLLKIMNLQQIGRNYYNPKDPIDIPKHRLVIWPGFTTSILQYEKNIMLCTDVSHKVLRSETVLDFMLNLRQKNKEREFNELVSRELIGLIVLTKYNNKTYRIDGIDWDQHPESTFRKADGSEVSFLDYYKEQYNEHITDRKQPMLVSQPKRRKGPGETLPGPALLIPELCYMTGLTSRMRNDFVVMKDLAVHTRLTPEERHRRIGKLLDYIHKDEKVQKELQDWGLNFDSNLLSFPGRLLTQEDIYQGGKKFCRKTQFADWSRETRSNPLDSVKPLNNWLLVYPGRSYDAANALIHNLLKVMPAMGMQMKRAIMIEVEDRTEAYLRVLQQKVTSNTQMVVCVLSSNRKDKYDAIKKYLCTDGPTPSQCVVARTLGNPQTAMAIATKIALQMNCKMGGELWKVKMPLDLVMIIGIDCYHDTTAGRRSVAGFVASTNDGMSRWFSHCVFQERGQELVDGLKFCLQAALRAWQSCNQKLPNRIIVYRDGVGDGQLMTVVSYEVKQFLDCLQAVGTAHSPTLTVIVVKKRVNARFFAEYEGRLQNPPPGTVIDVEVTRPEWYDFFIVSQAVRSGSVSPTHYNVIYDNSGLQPDHIQRLTYKLCHMYYNWPGIIRVPAPCQYAHKLAFLAGQSIHRTPDLSLANRLYYL